MTIRIALIRQEQTGGDGGAQVIIDLMLQALEQKEELDIQLLCRKWESSAKAQKVIIDPSYQGRKAKQSSFNKAIKKYLLKHRFHLIQSHERLEGCHIFRAGDGVHKVWLAQKAKISSAIGRWWLRYSPYHRALLKEEKRMFESKELKRVICNSQMVKQEILDNFNIDESKLTVIYNGVDHQVFTPVSAEQKAALKAKFDIPASSLVYIFSGSGFERKNLASTIDAFSQLNPHCHLLVVGRDKHSKRYQEQAQKLECSERIHFLGAQARENMAELYQTADVLVLPTLYDPFANVILEGLACGLPCITSSKCGAVDVITQNHCGRIIDAIDTTALVDAMNSYMNTKTLLNESHNAAAMSAQFSEANMKHALLNLYSELLEKHHD